MKIQVRSSNFESERQYIIVPMGEGAERHAYVWNCPSTTIVMQSQASGLTSLSLDQSNNCSNSLMAARATDESRVLSLSIFIVTVVSHSQRHQSPPSGY